jgi:hypothetical protein
MGAAIAYSGSDEEMNCHAEGVLWLFAPEASPVQVSETL